jgi:hypothetical protein
VSAFFDAHAETTARQTAGTTIRRIIGFIEIHRTRPADGRDAAVPDQ